VESKLVVKVKKINSNRLRRGFGEDGGRGYGCPMKEEEGVSVEVKEEDGGRWRKKKTDMTHCRKNLI